MNSFSSELDHILNNHDAAKRFSKNKLSLFKLYDYRGKEHNNGTLSWSFVMAGLGVILLGLHETTGLSVFRFLMAPLLVGCLILMFRIVRLIHNNIWQPEYSWVSAKFIVDIVDRCQKMNARKDQIQILQKAAQDQDTPATWWGWVETAIQRAENWSCEENLNKNAAERVAQKKIQVWRQKEKKKALPKVN